MGGRGKHFKTLNNFTLALAVLPSGPESHKPRQKCKGNAPWQRLPFPKPAFPVGKPLPRCLFRNGTVGCVDVSVVSCNFALCSSPHVPYSSFLLPVAVSVVFKESSGTYFNMSLLLLVSSPSDKLHSLPQCLFTS